MDPISTPVNEGLVGVEGQQQEQHATEQAQGATAAIAEQQPKQEQTPEQNAVYADMRRRAQAEAREAATRDVQAAKDALVAEWFGNEGITTYDQLQQRQHDAQIQQQYGIDPSTLKPLFDQWKETDPDFVRARESEANARLERDAQALGAKYPESNVKTVADLEKMPNAQAVVDLVKTGYTLEHAYSIVNQDSIIGARVRSAVNDALTKTAANAAASPGALGDGADAPRYYTDAEINRMSTKEIQAHYDVVMASLRRNAKG